MTESRDARDDDVLGWPLTGTHRVEASAGTGKTFALSILHTRLVVERGLAVGEIVAVTFTEAAADELRERLRLQLERASRLAAGDDADLDRTVAEGNGAEAATAAILARARARETPDAIASRIRRATADIDLAPIFTIHGFCRRVLADHAIASGEPLVAAKLLTSERALHEEVALDIFRRWTRTSDDARMLYALWNAPSDLARDLARLVQADVLLPKPEATQDDPDRLQQATAQLRAAWRAEGAAFGAALRRAHAAGDVKRTSLKEDALGALLDALDRFAADPALTTPATTKLDFLTRTGITGLARAGAAARMPDAPLLDAVTAFVDAKREDDVRAARRRVNLVHAVRDHAIARIAALKRERGEIGFDDLIRRVESAVAAPDGALVEALRGTYRAALVDEFQDTDRRQWSIFRGIFAGAADAALFLVGDPKQAIYRFRGGDVHTYHRAARDAQSTLTLGRNFRSRPILLDAVEAVFARGGATPFGDDATRFAHVAAGGLVDDAALVRAGAPVAAMHVLTLPLRNGDTTSTKKGPVLRTDPARELAAAASAARIRELLDDDTVSIVDHGRSRRLEPGDIAVLVGRNAEAERMRQALAERGIASATTMSASVFSSEEARELRVVFEALLGVGDEGRLRAALATVLIGLDATGIDALSRDESANQDWLDRVQLWRGRWESSGPLAVVSLLAAQASARLIALADGERRLANYLQVAERLQDMRATTLGVAGQIDWLARAIEDADDFDEEEQQRLESDADRVRIMTLHKAKGLEFGLVFLPFAMIAPGDPMPTGLALLTTHRDEATVVHAKLGIDEDDYGAARTEHRREADAEQRRLLYVGLTRARLAVWIVAGAINGGEKSAFGALLADAPGAMSADAVDAALDALCAAAPRAIVREPLPAVDPGQAARRERSGVPPALRVPWRVLRRDWWVHSFSQLARSDGASAERATDDRGAEDEVEEPIELSASPFVGARFGNALHAALENADFARWRGWSRDVAPEGEADILRSALASNGYVDEDEISAGATLLAGWIRRTLNVVLPEGVRLAELAPRDRRSELEFHFAMRPVAVRALIDLLHAHGIVEARSGFGLGERLEGLMTGRIDLVYVHGGRTYLLDYKSNRLADYTAAGLERAMREDEYDLQYLVYTLALHRWLRFRSAGYDYERDFGGVRYLFCRGIDPDRDDAPGVFATRPPRALIETLDALLAPPARSAA